MTNPPVPPIADIGEEQGTFACPICGEETPHYHQPEALNRAPVRSVNRLFAYIAVAERMRGLGHYYWLQAADYPKPPFGITSDIAFMEDIKAVLAALGEITNE